MPKQKTHSGTKDRIRITKTGKVQRRHASVGHNLQKKSAARKRRSAGLDTITSRATIKSTKRKLGV